MSKKKNLGQFFTTNSSYILQGFEAFVANKDVMDPFAGTGDLLNWANDNSCASYRGCDIDPFLINDNVILNDSLLVVPHSDFIITNPPYLGKNKMSEEMKTKYNLIYEDLYLHSIKRLIESDPEEGIIIIPVNFFSAENSDALRAEFLNKYLISKVNYFKNRVFEDTTYNVVAFCFKKHAINPRSQNIEFNIFPENVRSFFILEERYNYRIGGSEIDQIIKTKSAKFIRLTERIILAQKGNKKISVFFNDKKVIKEYSINDDFLSKIDKNIVLLNCIDTNSSESSWIKAEDISTLNQRCLVGKITSRNIAYVMCEDFSLEDQRRMIKSFNKRLLELRKKYNSLFLTNFRDNDRKRISFDFCYKFLTYCFING